MILTLQNFITSDINLLIVVKRSFVSLAQKIAYAHKWNLRLCLIILLSVRESHLSDGSVLQRSAVQLQTSRVQGSQSPALALLTLPDKIGSTAIILSLYQLNVTVTLMTLNDVLARVCRTDLVMFI